MATEKVIYVTEDGFHYNTREEAEAHEQKLQETPEMVAKNIIKELKEEGKRLQKRKIKFPAIVYVDRDVFFIIQDMNDLINVAAEYFRYDVHYYSKGKDEEDALIEKHLLDTSDIDVLLGFMFSNYTMYQFEIEYSGEIVKHLDENGKLDLGRFK